MTEQDEHDQLTGRERRVGLNEAVFRQVNEQIRNVATDFGLTGQPLDLVCECGDDRCSERIELTIDDYERLRQDPALFAVVPGHESAGAEDVVEKASGYAVVRKHPGGEEQLARETDPRA